MEDTPVLYYGDPINRSNPLMRGIISRWKVVPWYASGPRLIDLAARNHGTLTNSPTWASAAGRPGGSGSIGCLNTGYVTATAPDAAKGTTNVSASAWCNIVASTNSFPCLIGVSYTSIHATPYWSYKIGANYLADGKFDVESSITAYPNRVSSTSTYSLGRWYHVALTYDGTTLSLYVDGKLDASSASYSGNLTYGSGSKILVGANASATEKLNGYVDDPCIWRRTLSAAEVLALYNATRSAYDPTLNWYSHPIMMGEAAAPGGVSYSSFIRNAARVRSATY